MPYNGLATALFWWRCLFLTEWFSFERMDNKEMVTMEILKTHCNLIFVAFAPHQFLSYIYLCKVIFSKTGFMIEFYFKYIFI